MSFYKIVNEELLVAPTFVSGPGFTLTIEEKDSYTYPVDGWYWFDTLDEAMKTLIPGDRNPDAEGIISWDIQMNEALAWQSDPSVPTPWVDMAASAREIGREDLLNRILAEVEHYNQATSYLTELHQEYEVTTDAL